jgi:hypothetical protein
MPSQRPRRSREMNADRYRALLLQRRAHGRSFGLTIACLIDHAAAIATYDQRLAAEADPEVHAVMARGDAG